MVLGTATAQPAPPIAAWIGFIAMCIGMFMAILDIQIVATSLPSIQEALAIRPDQMSWIQTSYLIAEVIAIPLTGWLTRVLSLRGLFVIFTSCFCHCVRCLRLQHGFRIPRDRARCSGICGRRSDTDRLLRGLPALSGPRSGARHDHCRCACRSGSDRRPVAGGWITSTYSWQWLFLINVVPGILAVVVWLPGVAARRAHGSDEVAPLGPRLAHPCCRGAGRARDRTEGSAHARLDIRHRARSLSAGTRVWRRVCPCGPCRARRQSSIFALLADRDFALGCALSFILGMGLYGSVYLMPVFLAYVRDHGALRIGEIMLVTGAAQLIAAPMVVWLEQRVSGAASHGRRLCHVRRWVWR